MGAGHNPSFYNRRLGHAHQGVVGKVVLLNHALLNVNLSIQSGRQRKNNRALNLLCHCSRIDHGAAVDGTYNAVYTRLAVLH